MKSTSVLRKKTVGMDALRKKDRDRTNGKGAIRTNDISSPTVTSSVHGKNASSYPRTQRATTNMPMASGPITIDLHRFADENMNATEVVKKMLGDANEENIRGFHKSLIEAKQTVGGDLQRNVYRNYSEFVSISKEIANLDGDVMHLKMYLNEVRSIWDGFLAMSIQSDDINTNEETVINEIVLPSRKPSELMSSDMQSIYRAQLTALWENVEGSQRLVKYTVGRHIIREFVNFLELDPNTQQPRQHIHIFLLNDCILIAARKKRSMSTKHRLVAMYLWKLQNIRISDIKNSEGLVIGIKIISGNSAFFYRSDRLEDNTAFLHAYIRLSEERDEGLLDNSQVSNFQEPARNPNEGRSNNNNKGINLSEEDQQWLEELPDELEVKIALRQFEEAVTYIGKARKIISSYTTSPSPIIKEAMDQISKYTDSLGATISIDLGNPLLTKIQFQRYVDWLLRLDKGEKAREVFLATRSLIIKKRIRQLVFEGDTTTYINELALVVFTLIRNTCEWYRDSFKQNAMSSGFVTWVREQTEIYAEIYKRQVFYQNQLSCQVIADCFKSTLDQCSMLRKVGLDLKFLLEDLFLENIKETVLTNEKKIGVKVDKLAQNDNFSTVSSQNLGTDVKVTSSVVSFYNLLVKFVNEICLLAKLPLYNTVIESVSRLTEHYLRSMLNESQKRDLTKDQRAAALMNVSFVLDNVIPRVSSQLNYHFDRSIPELDSLRARLRELTYRK